MCFVKIFDRKYELAVTQHGNFIFGKYDDVDLYDFVASRAEGERRLKNLKNHKAYDLKQ